MDGKRYVGVAALCSSVLLELTGCSAKASRPNVVIVVIDTVRADHLSAYGYGRPTTPRIDSFARDAVRFSHAYSVSSWTVPAHASLFTGLYPATHGATQEHLQLDGQFPTLAETLRDAGYASVAFSGNPYVAQATGLARGFESMKEMWRQPGNWESGAKPHATNRLISEWLDRRPTDRPFFLFVNYIEAHFPYDAPAAYQKPYLPKEITAGEAEQAKVKWNDWYLQPRPFPPRVAAIRVGQYDAEITYLDAIVGELLDDLKKRGLYDDALIILVSDHGENLGANGHLDHVFSLYNSTVQVPFIMRLPHGRSSGVVRSDPVQLIDIFPTVAAEARISIVTDHLPGLNVADNAAPLDRAIVAEYEYPNQALGAFAPRDQESAALAPFRRRLRSIQVGSTKLIAGSDGRSELYDLAEDPDERLNVIVGRKEVAAELQQRLMDLLAQLVAVQPRADSSGAPRPLQLK